MPSRRGDWFEVLEAQFNRVIKPLGDNTYIMRNTQFVGTIWVRYAQQEMVIELRDKTRSKLHVPLHNVVYYKLTV